MIIILWTLISLTRWRTSMITEIRPSLTIRAEFQSDWNWFNVIADLPLYSKDYSMHSTLDLSLTVSISQTFFVNLFNDALQHMISYDTKIIRSSGQLKNVRCCPRKCRVGWVENLFKFSHSSSNMLNINDYFQNIWETLYWSFVRYEKIQRKRTQFSWRRVCSQV